MAELNFGLLTPPGSQSIGNAFVQGMDQAQESRARDLQMQQSVRKGQMDELTYRKALDTEARLNKYYSNIAANGGPKTPEEAIQAMLGSGVPHIQDLAAKLQIETLKNDQQLALYRAAKAGPAPGPGPSTMPTAVAAPMAPEPGSFGADVAARRAADMFAPPPVAGLTNMLPGAAVAPADVNNLGGRSVAEMIAERDRMIEIPGNAAKNRVASLNADILRASRPPVYHNVQGVGLVDPSTSRVITPSVEPKDSIIKQYEYALNQGFNGSLFDFKRALAAAGRTPAQPSAPTITQIVDPSNPNQMITIDARRYAGGGAGSPGVIGVSGKEPTAALRENKIESGKSLLADEISNLRAALNALNAARAIPSTERGTLSNISSSLASSGVGQIASRIVGTEAQTERDVISSSKLRLVNAIKQATGMSAQQLNSNVELQTMLRSLSDPSQSIEANIRNLDSIEKAYVNTTPPVRPSTPTGAPSSAQPASGFLVTAPNKNVYKFTTQAEADAFKKLAGIP